MRQKKFFLYCSKNWLVFCVCVCVITLNEKIQWKVAGVEINTDRPSEMGERIKVSVKDREKIIRGKKREQANKNNNKMSE